MFFDTILLNPQHKARFWHAWVAATRGVKALNKKQIREVDLAQLSIEIMKFLKNESPTPTKRFSLRLSVILVNGTIKLYREQLTLFHSEIFYFLTHITFQPVDISIRRHITSEFDIPLTPPVKKTKKKAAKKSQETPDSLALIESIVMPELQMPLQFPEASKARLEDITLREDAQPKTIEQLLLPDDFGESAAIIPTEQPEQYPHPTSLVIAQVHAEAGEYFQPPVLAEPRSRPEEEPRPIQPLAEVTLQPEKDVRSQVEQPSEMEDIIKLLEADLVAQRTKTTEVAEPPPAPVLEILPEGVAQLPELAAPVQEIIAPEVVAPVAEILPAEQERRAVDAESVRKVPGTEEEKEKAGEEKKDEPKKKEADKEKKKKKRVDSKKKEKTAKVKAAIDFLIMRRKKRNINFASVQQHIDHLKAKISDDTEQKLPALIPFHKVTDDLINDFWLVGLGREVVREGRSPRRSSAVVRPSSRSAPSTTLSVSGEGQRPSHLTTFADVGTPLTEPSPGLAPPSIPVALPTDVAVSTPIKRAAREIEIQEEVEPPKRQKIAEVSAPEVSQQDKSEVTTAPTVEQPRLDQCPVETPLELIEPVAEPAVLPQISQPTDEGIEQVQQIATKHVWTSLQPETGEASKIRHQKIIDIVRKWDFSQKELIVDDICRNLRLKPIRAIMARLFNDMLSNVVIAQKIYLQNRKPISNSCQKNLEFVFEMFQYWQLPVM